MKKSIFGLYQNLSNDYEQRAVYVYSTLLFDRGRFARNNIELYDEYINSFSPSTQLPDNQLLEISTNQVWESITTGH